MTCALRRNIKGQAYRHKIKRKAIKQLPENHGKMDTTYNQHDFEKEKQNALETLSNKIIEITTVKRPIRRFNPETGRTEFIDYNAGK